jgi:hypothetical protein
MIGMESSMAICLACDVQAGDSEFAPASCGSGVAGVCLQALTGAGRRG